MRELFSPLIHFACKGTMFSPFFQISSHIFYKLLHFIGQIPVNLAFHCQLGTSSTLLFRAKQTDKLTSGVPRNLKCTLFLHKSERRGYFETREG